MKRLGWEQRIAEILPAEIVCPAVGQGALAIETRSSGAGLDACAALDDADARRRGDRRTGRAGGSGRRLPGAHRSAREVREGRLRLLAVVASPGRRGD